MDLEKKTKVLTAALSVFLRYGYKRVTMADLADAATISRPALYLLFRNKEEIFAGVITQWVDAAVTEINQEMARTAVPKEKLKRAFEIWSVRPFELTINSEEAREIVDCSFDFAQTALRQGYETFERTITPVVASLLDQHPARKRLSPKRVAHILANAARGFKQTATTPDEMRHLIHDLLLLSLR